MTRLAGQAFRETALVQRLRNETALRAYYMRLHVRDGVEAEGLVEAVAQAAEGQLPLVIKRRQHVVTLLWPAAEADDPAEWEEQTFAELIFFLRAWSGTEPGRRITVLEERPLEVAEDVFRRAS